jgi:hypothetical protein
MALPGLATADATPPVLLLRSFSRSSETEMRGRWTRFTAGTAASASAAALPLGRRRAAGRSVGRRRAAKPSIETAAEPDTRRMTVSV